MPLGRAGSIPAQRTNKPPLGGFFLDEGGTKPLIKNSKVKSLYHSNSVVFSAYQDQNKEDYVQ